MTEIDTSGVVAVPTSDPAYIGERWMRWSDLTPFAQGFTAALLAEANAPFRKLSSEALATILRDCERGAAQEGVKSPPLQFGRWFWRAQQEGRLPDFPPRVLTTADDGKITFRSDENG